MRKLAALALILSITFSFLFNLLPRPAYAGELTTAVRIDRQSTSTSTGGLVCATTPASDNGTENNVQVIFPTGFTINSTASNWTVNTSNIPSDATAWPGISTATAVSGQIVTFPSNDLSQNTKYCFNFSSSSTLTTPSSTGNYPGTVRTRASTAVIDSKGYGISIVSNDQITVSATVPASPSDFEADLVSTNKAGGSTVRQNEEITFRLTYGSNLTTSTNITPQITWSLGTIAGSGTPSVEVLEYVVGSATSAYGSTSPIIDTVNRTITWPISSFPASTADQTVTFKLKTTSTYTEEVNISFGVTGTVLGPGTQASDSSINMTYKYNYTFQATPTPPGDSQSDGRSDGGASSPQPPLGPLNASGIEVREITPENSSIYITTNKPSTVTMSIGTNQYNLNQTIDPSSTDSIHHLFTLEDLDPNTRYYFKIFIENEDESLTTDLFTFITAASTGTITYDSRSLTVISNNVVLFDSNRTNLRAGSLPNIPIPTNSNFTVKFKLNNQNQLKNISIFSRNKNVLGINNVTTIKNYGNSNAVLELASGEFVSSLSSDKTTGEYELIARIEDYSGNMTETAIAVLKVISPFEVFEFGSQNPIENAKINLFIFNLRLKTYNFIASNILPIINPIFSNPEGKAFFTLPEGKYKAEVIALGYEPKTIEFNIGINSSGYPKIELKKQPFNIITGIKYYNTVITDLIGAASNGLSNIKDSNRFLDLIGFVSLTIFSLLLAFSILHKFSISPKMLPWLALYSFHKFSGKHEHIIQGVILDSASLEAIGGAKVYISLPNGKIISHTKTNSSGEFFATSPNTNVKVTASHKKFRTYSKSYTEAETKKRITLRLSSLKKEKSFSLEGIHYYTRFMFSTLFEAFLVITILLEIVLVQGFGILKVSPFIAISAISLILWASIQKEGFRKNLTKN